MQEYMQEVVLLYVLDRYQRGQMTRWETQTVVEALFPDLARRITERKKENPVFEDFSWTDMFEFMSCAELGN